MKKLVFLILTIFTISCRGQVYLRNGLLIRIGEDTVWIKHTGANIEIYSTDTLLLNTVLINILALNELTVDDSVFLTKLKTGQIQNLRLTPTGAISGFISKILELNDYVLFDSDTLSTREYARLFGGEGAGSPAGETGSVQLNDGGAFGYDTDFDYKNDTLYAKNILIANKLGIGTTNPTSTLAVGGNGIAGAAIYGTNTTYGVYGTAEGVGVYGYGSTGVNGYGTNSGVYGQGSTNGVYGSGGTYGVYGTAYDYAVYGYSASNYGVTGKGKYGVRGIGDVSYGVKGEGVDKGVVANGTNYDFYAENAAGKSYFAGKVGIGIVPEVPLHVAGRIASSTEGNSSLWNTGYEHSQSALKHVAAYTGSISSTPTNSELTAILGDPDSKSNTTLYVVTGTGGTGAGKILHCTPLSGDPGKWHYIILIEAN